MSKRPGDPGYAPGWCTHYRSPQHGETCEAGVRYDSFAKEDRVHSRCPCFIKPHETPVDRAHCEHLRPPTAKEIELHNEWAKMRTGMLVKVLGVIEPWRNKWQGKAHEEVIECPCCSGRLHLVIMARNGHVHGRCETKDCVQWME